MLFGNRKREFHFAHFLKSVESVLKDCLAQGDPRSQRVENDFGSARHPSPVTDARSSHRAREQLTHIFARRPRFQIGCIAKRFKIEFLDYLMQEHSDRTAT